MSLPAEIHTIRKVLRAERNLTVITGVGGLVMVAATVPVLAGVDLPGGDLPYWIATVIGVAWVAFGVWGWAMMRRVLAAADQAIAAMEGESDG